MKTPTQEQFQVVIDNLEKALKISKNNAPVDMMSVDIAINKKYACGTPMCHAGWYLIATSKVTSHTSYSDGAELMAEHLGFANDFYLKLWAKQNSDIWGNREGESMFCSENAFSTSEPFGLKTIIDHWKAVKERAGTAPDEDTPQPENEGDGE